MQIALVGTAPSSCRKAPFGDPNWKIWGCSPGLYPIASRVDAWWECHRFEPPVIGRPDQQVPWFSPEYVMWMAQLKVPVWMQAVVPEIPTSRRIPHEELVQKYGHFFFTSSLAWMSAMAIEAILDNRRRKASGETHIEGEDVIGYWGVDMAACLASETKVLTADLRYVPLGTVKVGDKLIAFDEQPGGHGESAYRKWRCATVLQVDPLMLPCYRVTMEDGTEFVASENHLWLTHAENDKRWKKTSELVTNHHRSGRPSRIVKPLSVWQEDRSWEAGYLAAAVDGEGHLHQAVRDGGAAMALGFAQRDNAMRAKVLAAMEACGFSMIEAARNGTDNDCIKHTVAGGRTKIMEFLGRTRPPRLLGKFDPAMLGVMHAPNAVAVKSCEFIGDHPVVGIKTDTKTFIAEGYASHNSEEYGYQRAGCQFFATLAASMGIRVYVPPESDLMVPPALYGISEGNHRSIKLLARKNELEAQKRALEAQVNSAQSQLHHVTGALDDMAYHMGMWLHEGPVLGTEFETIFPPSRVAEAMEKKAE